MPGTLNGQGTFVSEKRLDAEPQERFEKIMIHAYIDGEIKDCVIYKQVGNKKYFVKELEDETKTAYVGLLKKADCVREGTAYITVKDENENEHSVYKLMKNKLIAWANEEEDDDLDVYTFNYDITTNEEGELVASFKPADGEDVQVQIETVSEEPVVVEYTFRINPTPADATVVINGQNVSELTAEENTEITWKVSKEGYVSQEGSLTLTEDKELPVTLEVVPVVEEAQPTE